MLNQTLVSRSDDLVCGDKLLDSVSAPSNYTCHCKERCVELPRNSKHLIHESAVEVYVRADTLVYLAFLGDELWRDLLNVVVQSHILVPALGSGKLFDK